MFFLFSLTAFLLLHLNNQTKNMCFHNALSQVATAIESRFDARFIDKTVFKPIYHGNGFTFLKWPIITSENADIINLYNWGLIPFWTKTHDDALNIRKVTLNAQGETVFSKPSFKYSIINKRCLVLSSGFYEWQHIGNNTYPYYISPKNDDLMAMGGIYSEWTNKENGETLNTFSIITTVANALLSTIHNTKKRMPFILTKENEREWLNPHLSQNQISDLINPYKDDFLKAYTVGRLISSTLQDTNVKEVQKSYEYPELNQLF